MFRRLIAEISPPIALRVAARTWRRLRGVGWHTFEGSYSSIEEVPAQPFSYNDSDIAVDTAISATRGLRNAGHPEPFSDDRCRLLLPTIVSQLGTPLTVLDFGGGPARGLISIIDHVRGIDMSLLRYVVVETPEQCRAFEQHKIAIEVYHDIPDALPTPLVINAASVFQYIPDWRQTIARLAHLKPKSFVVSQTPVSDQPTYARLQLNIPGKRIAQWVFRRSEFTDVMSSLGYELTFTADHDLPITHAKAPGPSQMTSMVFQRASD